MLPATIAAQGDPKAPGTTLKVRLAGLNSDFASVLKVGDKVRPKGTSTAFKVIDLCVNGEENLSVEGEKNGRENPQELFQPFACFASLALTVPSESDFYVDIKTEHEYDIFKRVDQSNVYSKVLNKLEKGGCIGIFPEGGSHDR